MKPLWERRRPRSPFRGEAADHDKRRRATLFLAGSAARRHPTNKTWVSAPLVSITNTAGATADHTRAAGSGNPLPGPAAHPNVFAVYEPLCKAVA